MYGVGIHTPPIAMTITTLAYLWPIYSAQRELLCKPKHWRTGCNTVEIKGFIFCNVFADLVKGCKHSSSPYWP